MTPLPDLQLVGVLVVSADAADADGAVSGADVPGERCSVSEGGMNGVSGLGAEDRSPQHHEERRGRSDQTKLYRRSAGVRSEGAGDDETRALQSKHSVRDGERDGGTRPKHTGYTPENTVLILIIYSNTVLM